MAAQLEAKRSLTSIVQAFSKGQLSTPRLLLIAGALVMAVYVGLGVSYFNHRSERENLTSQVLNAQGALAAADAGDSPVELQRRLTELTDIQTLLENSFPKELKTPAVIDGILRRAGEHNVELVLIDISAPETVQVASSGAAEATDAPAGDATAATEAPPAEQAPPRAMYQQAVVTAQFRGSLPDLIEFMAALEARVGSASDLETFSLRSTSQGYTLDIRVQTFARQPDEAPAEPDANATPAAEGETP